MADALRSAQNFGNKATIPILGPAGDMFFGPAQDVAERLAYGDKITTGKGQTQQLHPGTVDLAGFVYPLAHAGGKLAGKGAQMAASRALRNVDTTAEYTPFSTPITPTSPQAEMAQALRQGSGGMSRREFLRKGATATAAAAGAAGGLGAVKIADNLLAPAAKAAAAPAARNSLDAILQAAQKIAGRNLQGWIDEWPKVDLDAADELGKTLAADLSDTIEKYPDAVLDDAMASRFDIRGAILRAHERGADGKVLYPDPYKEMGLKSVPSPRINRAWNRPEVPKKTAEEMDKTWEFLSKIDPEDAKNLVERWQVTGKWGTHTPDGKRIPDNVDMDYFEPEEWGDGFFYPHEESIADDLSRLMDDAYFRPQGVVR